MARDMTTEWLDAEFLTQCFKGKKKDVIKIITFSKEQAVPAGDNFMSNIIRIKVEYSLDNETKSTALIIKSSPVGSTMEGSYAVCEKKENCFYNVLLPEINKLYFLNISPEKYVSPIESVIVMEDLKVLGYEMKDRKTLLDFEHCKSYIEALAKLNASSYLSINSDPHLVESIGPNMFVVIDRNEKEKDFWQLIVKGSLKCLADTLENNYCEYKEECQVIRDVTDHLWQIIIDYFLLPNTYKTITHGDCWTNNAMFRYDASGKIQSVKTFDFQCCSFSPAVIDLVFVIWLSSNNDVRENRLDDLYHIYCDTFNSTLGQLGRDVTLTISRLKEEILRASPLILYCVAFRLPAHLFDGAFDMDDIAKLIPSEGLKAFKMLHQGKFYDVVFPGILKHLTREGVFKYLKGLT